MARATATLYKVGDRIKTHREVGGHEYEVLKVLKHAYVCRSVVSGTETQVFAYEVEGKVEAEEPYFALGKEIRRRLKQTATGGISYVALGSVMRDELMEKYKLAKGEVEKFLIGIARDLNDAIEKL